MSLAKKIKDMEKARAEARGGKGGVDAARAAARKAKGTALPKEGGKATMPKGAKCPGCQAKVGGMAVDQFDKHVNNCIS